MFDIGQNIKEVLLAVVALLGTLGGYYFGYKRGNNSVVSRSLKDDENK